MTSAVVLLAAGSGSRFGRGKPKQMATLSRQPLFLKSFHVFLKIKSVREIVLVLPKNKFVSMVRWVRRIQTPKRVQLIVGGKYRGESVRNGVLAVTSRPDVILIHDAARPLVSDDIVSRVEKAAFKFGVALAAWPLSDTLKLSNENLRVKQTIPRKNLWLAQTPQGFRSDVAKVCLLKPRASATDDVELAERKGFPVKIVAGAPTNMKVTYPHDLKICQALAGS